MSVLHMAKPAMNRAIDWNTWKARWEGATDLSTRLALLHSCLDATVDTPDEEAERTCLLMAVAHYPEYVDVDWHECAKKALVVLYNRVFPHRFAEHIDRHGWYIHPKLVEAFFEFFMPDPRGRAVNRPIVTQSFMADGLDSFIDRICRYVWEGDQEFFVPYKPSVIEILNSRRRLRVLFGNWDRFDDPSLKKLEELALQHAESIEEAVECGSHAAEAMLIVRTSILELPRRKEKERIAQGKRQLLYL